MIILKQLFFSLMLETVETPSVLIMIVAAAICLSLLYHSTALSIIVFYQYNSTHYTDTPWAHIH